MRLEPLRYPPQMFKGHNITALVLIAIPVALFSLFQREDRFVVSLTNATATLLIFFAWHSIKKLTTSRFDLLLLRIYLIGLLDFSACLGFNSVLRGSYDGAVMGNHSAAGLRSFTLTAVPTLMYAGLALAVIFAFLCVARIFFAIRDHHRRTRSLKATNV
jgi:hypothetical protein